MIDINKPGYYSRERMGQEAVDFYAEQGFLVVYDALTAVEVEQLKSEAVAVCRQERGPLAMHFGEAKDEAAFPAPDVLRTLPTEDVMKHFLCIHQAHKTSPVLREYLAHPVVRQVLTRVIGPNVKCMQSMLFIKSAGKPGQAWHQDEDFIPTRDRSLAGAWMAMDDAVVENGCLWVIPGSHRPGILWPMYPHNDPRYDCALMSYDFPYRDEEAVPVEVSAGAVVFFNGYLLHKSEPNHMANGFRRVLVNHYMSAESLLPWRAEQGVPQARCDYRDVVLVAGEDPYAWKGTVDVAHPFVRAAGDGGCGDGRVSLADHKKGLASLS